MAQPAGPPNRKAKKSSIYPTPLTVSPLAAHKQTFIFLHGRGSNASIFGPELLATSIPEFGSLPLAFPHAKFIFPTASTRRATLFERKEIHQWFDNWSVEATSERQELQIEGLRETSAFVHGLLNEEIAAVGAETVVLGGLSQGCAATLISMLLWEAMRNGMKGVINADDEDDPFARDDAPERTPVEQAIDYLREELDVPQDGNELSFQRVPIFLGHRIEDEKVAVSLGRIAEVRLRELGTTVQWHEYQGLGHWYSGEMLKDIVTFIKESLLF